MYTLIQAKLEFSERCFNLTTEIIPHNPANYTAWSARMPRDFIAHIVGSDIYLSLCLGGIDVGVYPSLGKIQTQDETL